MSVQSFDNLQILLQLMQTTRNLAQNMVNNANTHIAMANAQSPALADSTDPITGRPIPGLIKIVSDTAAAYLSIINRATTWVTNNNAQATAAVGLIGATLADLNNYAAPLKTAATNLQAADKSTYAAIITACNAVLSGVATPASVWGG